MVHLYRTTRGTIVSVNGICYGVTVGWDDVFTSADAHKAITGEIASGKAHPSPAPLPEEMLAPLESQEVWAAGVTYFRSRDARIDESKAHGGQGDCYARVYEAARPEIFFKATPHRVVGHGKGIRIRRDSNWNVPEPELTLAINVEGRIIGYTVGNDVSSRDIEGQNPLYLPQAKVYNQCCALGPCLMLATEPFSRDTAIELSVARAGARCFHGTTSLSQMKRSLGELVAYCYRENSFPAGCYLMTGTGIIPPPTFTLESGDEVSITIEPIGTLSNRVIREQ